MDFETLKEFRNLSDGFVNDMGLTVTEVRDGEAVGTLKLEKRHGNPIGSIHGGCLFSLVDTIGGVAATTKGRMVTTVDGSIHYLNAAHVGDDLRISAKVAKAGKTLAVVNVEIHNQEGKIIAVSLMTYHFMSMDFDVQGLVEAMKTGKKKYGKAEIPL